jgi:BNR repeat-containing family member
VRRTLATLALIGLLGALVTGTAAAAPTRFSSSGAWSWFADPRALDDGGLTYAGWVDNAGSIVVTSRSHATGARVLAVVRARFQYDDHANPALYLRTDGRLLVMWSGHLGGRMYYRVSTRPRDVSAWGPERVVPLPTDQYGITYPNLVFLPAEGRLYLFWRGLGFNPMWTYSDNEGETWGPARTLLNGGFRHYVKYASNGTNTIHLVYNQRHPRTGPTDVFYLRIRGGNYERVGGTAIRPLTAGPVGPAQSQRIYTAALHGGARSWVWDVATTLDGRPIAVYASFPSTTNHHYWFARWTGSRWDSHDIVAAGGTMQTGDAREPNYSGGITLDHEDPATVYLSRVRAGVFHIERWRTSDGGAHFSIARVSTSTAGSYRPISPRGERNRTAPSMLMLRGPYRTYKSYLTAIDAVWAPALLAQQPLGEVVRVVQADDPNRAPEPRNPLSRTYPD